MDEITDTTNPYPAKGEFPCRPFAHYIRDNDGRCSHLVKHKPPANHILAVCENVEGCATKKYLSQSPKDED